MNNKIESNNYKSWVLTDRQICDLELIMDGSFTPLLGFLNEDDYQNVLNNMKLGDGSVWPIPINLDVDDEFIQSISNESSITLRDKEGFAIAILDIESKWKPNKDLNPKINGEGIEKLKIAGVNVYEGILENNPASIIKSPKYKVDPPKVLEQTIMKVLLTPIESEDWEISRDRTILEVFYSTGIRLSELTQINLGDINFIDNEIIIFGKGRKERMVFFGQEVADAIKLYLSDHEIHLSNYYKRKEYALRPLFVTKKGIRIKQREVQERIKIFFDFVASNLSKTNNKRNSDLSILINSINPTPHLIRHTFATHLINAGVKMEIVKDLLGHEKLSTTQIYTHLDVKGMKKILDNAHPHA